MSFIIMNLTDWRMHQDSLSSKYKRFRLPLEPQNRNFGCA